MTLENKKTVSSKPELRTVDFDALVDDLFGLNIRALKSLMRSFASPSHYYHAAMSFDWHNKFTPSFRLWFTLMAIIFFFQFFWAGSDSGTLQNTMVAIQGHAQLPEGVSVRSAAIEHLRWTFGFLPFILAFSLFALAAIFPFWGRPHNFVIRQRLLFITVLPSTFVAIFLTIALGVTKGENIGLLLLATYLCSLILDMVTAYRGAYSNCSSIGRLWRAALLALAIMVVSFAAGLLANVAGVAAINLKYG